MKPLFYLALALIFQAMPAAAAGGIPAKEALRTVGRVKGASWLERVVQISGDRGMDQPAAWRIVAGDGKGGFREFFVNKKGIISEGPVPPAAAAEVQGSVIDAKKFVTDSTHAFVAATNAAKKAQVGFDAANFRLRCVPGTKTPVWTLELVDGGGVRLAEVNISAATGKVTTTAVVQQPVAQAPPPPPQQQPPMDAAREAVTNGVRGVGRGLQRAGEWIHRKFTPQQ